MATRVSLSQCSVRGVQKWRVRYWDNGKPVRRFFDSKADAKAEQVRLKSQVERFGSVWQGLSALEREQLISAYVEAKSKGLDIRKAIAGVHSEPAPTLSTVIDEVMKSKLSNGRDKEYVRNASCVWKQFAKGAEHVPINLLPLSHLERFVESKKLEYRRTVRGRLSAIFSFAVRRGYRADNPCQRLEFAKVTRQPIHVFTPEQFGIAVQWLAQHQPKGLAWFVLSTCCGLRPDEARKTTDAEINFEERYIRIEGQTTKVRTRRVVYPKPEAIKLLKWAIKQGGVIPLPKNSLRAIIAGRNNRVGGLRQALNLDKWPKDITRHTAASYWLACKGESVALVAKMLGHSERICESRYKAVKTQAQAAEFWKAVKLTAY